MAKQTINIGTAPNDGTGTPLRTAFDYCNLNFTELYTAVGPSGNNIVVPGTATITGDLTVDTSTLKVDSANNRVGIGTASPGYLLDAQAATAVAQILSTTGTNAAYLQISNTGGYFYLGRENSAGTTFAAPAYSAVLYAAGAYPLVTTVNGGERYRIASDGVATWSNVGGVAGTAMTLNSTGLGVGASPTAKLHVQNSSLSGTTAGSNVIATLRSNGSGYDSFLQFSDNVAYNAGLGMVSGNLYFYTSGAERGRFDTSGNLLVGTTSSIAGSAHSFRATGTTSSFWAAAFLHEGTTANGRLQIWSIPNANDTGSYFVYASNSGGNCFNVLGNGNVQNTSGTYGTISDLRLKENISDARNYLADLLKLRVVKYSLKSEASAVATKIGFIAQEVEQVFPTLVETNSDEVKSIKTTVLIPMLLKAIQELTARVEALEA
jgi:hypothetical protein